ncbi:hypothetical protein [Nostoc sp.]|uniref:hypothetical protein n=1 Tax=Nostoc sp. TaxID=1180 RepID=UPI002FF879CA
MQLFSPPASCLFLVIFPTNPSNPPDGERRRLDLKAAATKFGVTEEKLREALGTPARPPSNSSN